MDLKIRPPAYVEGLEEEVRMLRDLVAQYHHHLKVSFLLAPENFVEQAAWLIQAKQLQQAAEWRLPALK